MKRDIVFRGKDIKTGEWFYGDLEFSRYIGRAHIHTYNEDGIYCRQVEVDPDSVGQYTGLKDDKGTAIYEGDIIVKRDKTFGTKLTGVVVYNSEFACFFINYEKYGIKVSSNFVKSEDYNDGYSTVKCEYEYDIIGNVYDNKELLENKEL